MLKQLALCLILFLTLKLPAQSIEKQIESSYKNLRFSSTKEAIITLNNLSLLLCRDSASKAKKQAELAFRLCDFIPENQYLKNQSRNSLAICYLCLGKADSALLIISQNHQRELLFSQTYLIKALSYEYLNNKDSSIYYYRLTVENSNTEKEIRNRGFAQLKLAGLLKTTLNQNEYSHLLNLSYRDLLSAGDHFLSAYLLKSLGELYLESGNFEYAATTLFKAFEMADSYADKEVLMETLFLLGRLFETMNEISLAEAYYRKALAMEVNNNSELLSGIQNGLASLMHKRGQNSKARHGHHNTFVMAGKINKFLMAATSLSELSTLFLDAIELQLAGRFIILSWQYAEKSQSDLIKAKVWYQIGEYYSLLGENEKSITALNLAKQLAEKNKIPCLLKEIIPLTANQYDKLHLTKEATVLREQLSKIEDSIFLLEKKLRVTEMEKHTGNKEKFLIRARIEKLQLRLTNELNQYKITNKVLLSITFLCLSFILFIIFRRPRFFKHLIKRTQKGYKKPLTQIKDTQTRIPRKSEEYTHYLSISDENPILKQLKQLFEKDKIYLDPELNLRTLSQKLSTNTAYLSKLINQKYHQNFNSFVNSYRIEESVRLMKNSKNTLLTLEAISNQAGFKSKSSFNSFFKKQMGCTPSSYLQKLQENLPVKHQIEK